MASVYEQLHEPLPEVLAFQLARAQQHSFLNDVQVIMGWLQMQEPDRALAHVEAVAAKAQWEREQLQNMPSSLAPWLWTWVSMARLWGIPVDLEVRAGSEPMDLPMLAFRYCIGELFPIYNAAGDAAVKIFVVPKAVSITYSRLGEQAVSLYERLSRHPALAQWLAAGIIRMHHDAGEVHVTLLATGKG